MKGDFSRFTFDPAKAYRSVRMQQGRVLVDADWNEQVAIGEHLLRTRSRHVIGISGVPSAGGGFEVRPGAEGKNLVVGPGVIYVDGIRCVNDREFAYEAQPYLPGGRLPAEPGTYVAYLDVWERHVTAIEDPSLAEPALRGPDTATRTRIVWQVKLEDVEPDDVAHSAPLWPSWWLRNAESRGELRPGVHGELPPRNQLYRVEVHDSGPEGTATFKWSRDNGAIAARVEALTRDRVTVRASGRRGLAHFVPGTWIELSDERRVLSGQAGVVAQIREIDGAEIIVMAWPAEFSLGEVPVARHWNALATITSRRPVDLEEGLRVEFRTGRYRCGDYWMIPVRAVPEHVLWPRGGDRRWLFQPGHGIEHHYCGLARVERSPTGLWRVLRDERRLFSSLVEVGEEASGPPEALRITQVLVEDADGSARPLLNDTEVSVEILARGLRIELDRQVAPSAVIGKPILGVTVELPFPFDRDDRALWGSDVAGFEPLALPGTVDALGNAIHWHPEDGTRTWLEDVLFPALAAYGSWVPVRARVGIRGSAVFAHGEPEVYLDGRAFGRPDPAGSGRVDLELPSGGGGQRASDFEMWFWLVPPEGPGG